MIYKKNWKYILKKEIINKKYQLKALKDFSDVKKGDFGGFVRGYRNLSQTGDCWIYDKSKVFGFAEVTGNAVVKDNAHICECAKVCENSIVDKSTLIYGYAEVSGNAHISLSTISGNAKIDGNSKILNKTYF